MAGNLKTSYISRKFVYLSGVFCFSSTIFLLSRPRKPYSSLLTRWCDGVNKEPRKLLNFNVSLTVLPRADPRKPTERIDSAPKKQSATQKKQFYAGKFQAAYACVKQGYKDAAEQR